LIKNSPLVSALERFYCKTCQSRDFRTQLCCNTTISLISVLLSFGSLLYFDIKYTNLFSVLVIRNISYDCSIRVTAKLECFESVEPTSCNIASGCKYLWYVSFVGHKYLQLVNALLTLASICKGNQALFFLPQHKRKKAIWPCETISCPVIVGQGVSEIDKILSIGNMWLSFGKSPRWVRLK